MSSYIPDVGAKVTLFAQNAQAIKSHFTWQSPLAKRLAAMLYAQENRPIDCDAIRNSHDLMKQNTGVFSSFRGHMALGIAALLSLSPNPPALFNATQQVYAQLRDTKLRPSDYLAVAAYQIAAQTDPVGYATAVSRTREFYDRMKAQHFFRTGQDDYIFAAMLGLSQLDVTTGAGHIEQLYERLKGEFRDKNSVQALAQVLVLGESDDSVVNRLLTLRAALRAQKIRLDKSYTLPALGILALLPVDSGVIVREIDQARSFLRAQKGFGAMTVAPQELLLYAAGVVADSYARDVRAGVLTATISTSITNIIIAQQTATMAAISASTATTASASA